MMSAGGSSSWLTREYTAGQNFSFNNEAPSDNRESALAVASLPARLTEQVSASYSLARATTKAWVLKMGQNQLMKSVSKNAARLRCRAICSKIRCQVCRTRYNQLFNRP